MCILHGIKDYRNRADNGLPLLRVLDLIKNAKSVSIVRLFVAIYFLFSTSG
jgi:hypothetical protein